MKKLVSLLTAVFIFLTVPIVASAESINVSLCKSLISSLDDNASLEAMEDIAYAGMKVEELTENELRKVNTSKLNRLDKELLFVTCSPMQACDSLRSFLKDPTSLRLYSDVLCIRHERENKNVRYLYQIIFDGKNAYGAYAGATSWLCVAQPAEGGIYYLAPEDQGYMDLSSYVLNHTEEELKAEGVTYFLFSGKRIAEVIECDYSSY